MKKLILFTPILLALSLFSCNKVGPVPNGYTLSVIPYYSTVFSIDSAQAFISSDTSSDLSTKVWTNSINLFSTGSGPRGTFYNLQPGSYMVYVTGRSSLGKPVSGTTIVNLTYYSANADVLIQ